MKIRKFLRRHDVPRILVIPRYPRVVATGPILHIDTPGIILAAERAPPYDHAVDIASALLLAGDTLRPILVVYGLIVPQ